MNDLTVVTNNVKLDQDVEVALGLIDPESVSVANILEIGKYTFKQTGYDTFMFVMTKKELSLFSSIKLKTYHEVLIKNGIVFDSESTEIDLRVLTEELKQEYLINIFKEQKQLCVEKGFLCTELKKYHTESIFNGSVSYTKTSKRSSVDVSKLLKGISRFCRWDTITSASVDDDIVENIIHENSQDITKEAKIKQFIGTFYAENPIDDPDAFAMNLYTKTSPELFSDEALNKKISMLRLRFNVYFRVLSSLCTHLPIRLIDSKVTLGVEIENISEIDDWDAVEYEDIKIKFIPIVQERASVDNTRINMDRRFVSNNTEGRLGFVIMHEVMHVALMHLFRHATQPVYESLRSLITVYNSRISSMYRVSLDDDTRNLNDSLLECMLPLIEKLRSYQNMAMDNPINITCLSEQARLKVRNPSIQPLLLDCPSEDSKEWIHCTDLSGMISEEIYELMEERQIPSSYSYDNHISILDDSDSDENTRRMWENRIRKAILESNGLNSTGSPISTLLEKALQYTSRVNYKERLREAVVNENASEISWRKPNRRYLGLDIYMPSSAGSLLEIVILADTSGSMGGFLEVVATEIISIAKSFQNYVIHFYAVDTDICYYEKVTSSDENVLDFDRIADMLKGGGGTCFLSFFKHVEENHHGKLVVGISDMAASFPESYTREPLWLVPEEYESTIEGLQSSPGYSNYALLYNEHINE